MDFSIIEASAGGAQGIELGWISWLIVGLIAGGLARWILPGDQKMGCFLTMLLGVIGAVVGGLIAGLIFGFDQLGFWNIWTWLFAILGSIIVLLIYGLIFGRKGRSRP